MIIKTDNPSTYMDNPKNYTPFPLVAPETLTPHPDNPNHHPAGQIEALAGIIRANGWRAPIVVSSRSGFIIKGHGRYLAAKKLGVAAPVEYQEYPDEEAEIRDLVADNKIAELSMLDNCKIAELRKRFKESGNGWGDTRTGGQLLSKQFSKLEEKKPKEMKYPILILENQKQFEMFEAVKSFYGGASDAAVFAKILTRAFSKIKTERSSND